MRKFEGLDVLKFLNEVDAVMFDCDGVLWVDSVVINNANTLIIKLRSLNKKVFLITNAALKTREELLVKFNKLGFQCTISEILSPSYLAAMYLKENNFTGKVYTVGSIGTTRELEKVGITSQPIGPDLAHDNLLMEPLELDDEVIAVIVGFYLHLSYKKMYKAASYLSNKDTPFIATHTEETFRSLNKDTLFIATNTDESVRVPNGLAPGAGAIVKGIKIAVGREPVVMGKPSAYAFEYLKRLHSLSPSRVLMVGDRDDTDILFAKMSGLQSLLVLTGVTKLGEIREDCIPDFYLESVGEFYELLRES